MQEQEQRISVELDNMVYDMVLNVGRVRAIELLESRIAKLKGEGTA